MTEDTCSETKTLLCKEESSTTPKNLEQDGTAGRQPLRRYGLILPTIFFVMFGSQLGTLVLSEWTQSEIYKEKFSPQNTSGDMSHCNVQNKSDPQYDLYEEVQQETAKWTMVYSFAELVPAACLQVILTSYTDAYGRKFLLYLAILGACVKGLVLTLVVQFEASFWFITGACIISGFTGSLFTLFSASSSIVADITTSGDQRTLGLVTTESMIFLATISSSFLSGYLIDNSNIGFAFTSLIAVSLCACTFLFAVFVPESLPKEKQCRPKPICQTLKKITDFYISDNFKGKRAAYILLQLSFGMAILCGVNRNNLETLYLLGRPLCWNPSKIGVYLMVRSFFQGIFGLLFLKLFQRCISDTVVAIMSTVSTSVSYVVEAFAKTTLVIYMVPAAGAFSFLVAPMTQGLMSSMTPAEKQGSMFAGLMTMAVLSTLLGTLTQNSIYSATVSIMNGFVFLILAVLSLINMIMLVAYKYIRKNENALGIMVDTSINVNPC